MTALSRVFIYCLLISTTFLFSNCTENEKTESSEGTETVSKKKKKKYTGLKKSYRDDGSLLSEVPYVDGKKNGTGINYYKDGGVQLKIDYKDGIKHGKHLYYYQDGTLYKSSDYSEGELDGFVTFFDRDGDIKAKIPYKNGFLGVGTEVYATSGKMKAYINNLKIITRERNQIARNGSYDLNISLSDYDDVKEVFYYIGDLTDGQYLNESTQELYTKNGTAEWFFTSSADKPAPSSITVTAEIKTRDKHPVLLKKVIQL